MKEIEDEEMDEDKEEPDEIVLKPIETRVTGPV